MNTKEMNIKELELANGGTIIPDGAPGFPGPNPFDIPKPEVVIESRPVCFTMR